jgi:hypothetical protein
VTPRTPKNHSRGMVPVQSTAVGSLPCPFPVGLSPLPLPVPLPLFSFPHLSFSVSRHSLCRSPFLHVCLPPSPPLFPLPLPLCLSLHPHLRRCCRLPGNLKVLLTQSLRGAYAELTHFVSRYLHFAYASLRKSLRELTQRLENSISIQNDAKVMSKLSQEALKQSREDPKWAP